ncbi:hypothetical protein D9M69_648820 [compost metagenome]
MATMINQSLPVSINGKPTKPQRPVSTAPVRYTGLRPTRSERWPISGIRKKCRKCAPNISSRICEVSLCTTRPR